MSEVLVLSPISRTHPCLDLIVPSMSDFQLIPNLSSQILCLNLIKFRFSKGTKQVLNRLVVGVVHISRSWSKKVNQMNIRCVLCNIPNDLTLAAKESGHPPLPHLVALELLGNTVCHIANPFRAASLPKRRTRSDDLRGTLTK
jgi:hypothetical protein